MALAYLPLLSTYYCVYPVHCSHFAFTTTCSHFFLCEDKSFSLALVPPGYAGQGHSRGWTGLDGEAGKGWPGILA